MVNLVFQLPHFFVVVMFCSATVIGWNAALATGLICNWTDAIEFTDFNCTCNDSNAILGKMELELFCDKLYISSQTLT